MTSGEWVRYRLLAARSIAACDLLPVDRTPLWGRSSGFAGDGEQVLVGAGVAADAGEAVLPKARGESPRPNPLGSPASNSDAEGFEELSMPRRLAY